MRTEDKKLSEATGTRIKQLRLKNGWTQSDFAEKLSVSIPAISKIEAGITTINLKRLHQITEIFEVSVSKFLSLTPASNELSTFENISILKERISVVEGEILKLQNTAISLYEELKKKAKN